MKRKAAATRGPQQRERRTVRSLFELGGRAVAIVAASVLLPTVASAGEAPSGRAPSPPELRLHQSTKACGKKWVKRFGKLSGDQLAWMLQAQHTLYRVEAFDRTLLTMEVLSTPSLRGCDLQGEWDKKETTIRVVYFLSNGRRKVELHHFAKDDVFFNQAPSFYPTTGKALLSGIDFHGRGSSRWLELAPLKYLYQELQHRARWSETVLASFGSR